MFFNVVLQRGTNAATVYPVAQVENLGGNSQSLATTHANAN